MIYKGKFKSRFPLQTPRSHAGRFCLWTGAEDLREVKEFIKSVDAQSSTISQ